MWCKEKGVDSFILALVFLYSMGFMLQATNILFLIFGILLFRDKGKLVLKKKAITSFWILCTFSILYVIIMLIHGERGIIVLGCPIAFYIGNRVKNCEINTVMNGTLLLSGGMASHVLLNFAYEISRYGMGILTNSRHIDIWSKTYSTATGVMVNASMAVGLLFYFLFLESRKTFKIIGLTILILITIYDIALGGRTYLFLLIIAFILSFVLRMILTQDFAGGVIFLLRLAVITAFVCGIIVIVFYAEGDKLSDFFENSYFYHRFFREGADQNMFETPRTERKIFFLKNMFQYLWGGNNLMNQCGGRSHELWLDTFDQAGILPYLLIVIYTFASIKRMLKVVFCSKFNCNYRVALGAVWFCMLAQFFMEPVLIGAPILVFSYCMIDGMICNLLTNKIPVNDT